MWAMMIAMSTKPTMACQMGVLHLLMRREHGVEFAKAQQLGNAERVELGKSPGKHGELKREQERKARGGNRSAHYNATENQLRPALNFLAGGCTPLTRTPPPLASQTRSVLLNVMTDPQDKKEDDPQHKRPGDVVVDPLRPV